MQAKWELDDWYAPDLDRGLIVSKTLDAAGVKNLSKKEMWRVFKAAKTYADKADKEGIAVTVDEWFLAPFDQFV
jgi:hypothetical protein